MNLKIQTDFSQVKLIMTKKNITLVLIILILTAVVLVAATFYVVKIKFGPANQNTNRQPDIFDSENFARREKESCQNTANPQECEKLTYDVWSTRIYSEILETKDYNRCPELGLSFQIDNCYSQLAYNLNNKQICEAISNTNVKKTCLDSLIPLEDNFSSCHQLDAKLSRQYCYNKVVANMKSQAECNNLSAADRNQCLEIYITQQALKDTDYDLCLTIPTEAGRQNCLKLLPKDSDGDKLSDYAERHFFNTDPNNPDTDGDGYSDGDEVKGGYNPRGAGSL